MIAFTIITIALISIIILFAIVITKKKNPPFVPPKVESEPDLNKLDNLITSVKKKESPKTESVEKQTEKQDIKEDKKTDVKKDTQEEKEEKKKIGSRGSPPKQAPRIDIKQAMKNKEIIDRKQ